MSLLTCPRCGDLNHPSAVLCANCGAYLVPPQLIRKGKMVVK